MKKIAVETVALGYTGSGDYVFIARDEDGDFVHASDDYHTLLSALDRAFGEYELIFGETFGSTI